MDSSRFDHFTKRLAFGVSRRSFLGGATAAGAASVVGRHATAAQEASPAATPAAAQEPADSSGSTTPTYLFVQQASGGTMAPTGTGEWELTLTGVSPQTVFFTDRPARQAGVLATARFLELDGMFTGDDPPNAAVVLAEPASAEEDAVIVELREPVYDAAAGTLRYTVTVLGEGDAEELAAWSDRADASLPETFGHVALFIDGAKVACTMWGCVTCFWC
jgi:hypothetical protein